MTQQRKIWELQDTTICKVVGMALNVEDLRKISRKFGLRSQDTQLDETFVIHSAIVRTCGEENRISRHVQKLIEKRFSGYEKRLGRQDLREITGPVLKGYADLGVPVWVVLWQLATRQFSDGEKVQTALFGFLHMLEHELVKDFWKSAGSDQDEREKEHRSEINRLSTELIKLRSLNDRLETVNQRMKTRLIHSSGSPASAPASTTNQRSGISLQDQKVEKLKFLLEESRKKNLKLEEECDLAKKQIASLIRELVAHENVNFASGETSAGNTCACPLKHCLQGKRIAMVGGIDSLEVHYRNLVEQSGGEFCRHDGTCCRGERKLEECIRNADLVVCPVGVNSHFGATGVKKVCKRHGISCRFPDSAGLGSLRTILLQHFTRDQEIPRDSASNGLE